MGIKASLKKQLFENRFLYRMLKVVRAPFKRSHGQYTIENAGLARLSKDIEGCGHHIVIGEDAKLYDTAIRIRGNNNRIIFGKNCFVGEGCSFWMEGDNITIEIGDGTTFTCQCHFCAQEDNVSIRIGKDCMFSNHVTVRTSDAHPIYDKTTGERINPPADVVLGKHVWIAPNSKIMKGAQVGDGAIIESDTMVTKSVPANTLVVGHPARVVKENIEWTREALF